MPGNDAKASWAYLNPDGRSFWVVRFPSAQEWRFARVSIDGTAYKDLAKGASALADMTWTRDGRAVLYAESTDGHDWRIMRISADGGNPTFTGLEVKKPSAFWSFDLSPDGKRIVFSGTLYSISAK